MLERILTHFPIVLNNLKFLENLITFNNDKD